MRKDKGLSTDLDRLPLLTWVMSPFQSLPTPREVWGALGNRHGWFWLLHIVLETTRNSRTGGRKAPPFGLKR